VISHRTANEGDAAAISALISSLQSALVFDPAGRGAEEFLASVSTETVRGHLASQGHAFLLAHDDDRLIGVIAIKDRSHLFYFFVDRAHQRRGVGRKLWELARAQAMAGGHSRPFSVLASMNAVPAYSRLGFRVTGRPFPVHGVQCVHMVAGEARGVRSFSMLLPRENSYPAMNAAAADVLHALGPAFTGTLDVHIPTAIAAAASLAGSVVLREVAAEPEELPAERTGLSASHRRQLELLSFIQIFAPKIDPGIDRGIAPAAGLRGNGWDGDVPPRHSPLFDADTMIGKLADLLERVTEQHGISPPLRGHVAALAAMKLIAAGHSSGLLDQKVGKALTRHYMAAGCRTSPVPLPGK
jgi:GNAT superfamily N-acetyltransferase